LSNTSNYYLKWRGDFDWLVWTNDSINHQITNYSNGNLKSNLSLDSVNTIIYSEFSEEGELKITLEVKKIYHKEYIPIEDEFGNDVSITIDGFVCVPNGKYQEYKTIHSAPHVITSGNYTNGLRTGIWWTKETYNAPVNEFKYNNQGEMVFFTKYYLTKSNSKADWEIAISGKCKISKNSSTPLKIGKWKHYNHKGELISKVIYKHITP
jgi:antitoxin component YwqK of YwqJK toxin-antitoxin module